MWLHGLRICPVFGKQSSKCNCYNHFSAMCRSIRNSDEIKLNEIEEVKISQQPIRVDCLKHTIPRRWTVKSHRNNGGNV